jgi:hypothetical protein
MGLVLSCWERTASEAQRPCSIAGRSSRCTQRATPTSCSLYALMLPYQAAVHIELLLLSKVHERVPLPGA